MSTIQQIVNEKPRSTKRVRTYKRLRLRCLRNTVSAREVQELSERAEEEEAMSRYEHSLEVA